MRVLELGKELLEKKDKEGFLYYVGRKDAMIKKEGYRVSPTEIEELLMGHQDVFEAVACGMKRETAKNEIVALVATKREIDIKEVKNLMDSDALAKGGGLPLMRDQGLGPDRTREDSAR